MDPLIPTRTSSKHWQNRSIQDPLSRQPAPSARRPPALTTPPPPPVYTGRSASRDHPLYSTWASAISPGINSPERERFREFVQREISIGRCTRDANGKIDSQDLIARYKVSRRQSPPTCLQSTTPANPLKRKSSTSELEGSHRLGAPPAYRTGTNISQAIDLTSPPTNRTMASTQHTHPPRRSSHVTQPSFSRTSPVVLPPWQPDSEATHCASCTTEFGVMKRKHHCRKCGKVVCDACSRHRITMPTKYIVQPPDGASASPFAFLSIPLIQRPSPSVSGDGTASQNTTSASHEAVRVCNPCVPDPNYSPPTQTPLTSPSPQSSRSMAPIYSEHRRSRQSQNYNNLAPMSQPFISTRVQVPPALESHPPRIPPRGIHNDTPAPAATPRAFPFPTYAGRPHLPSDDPQQSQPLHLRRATMAHPSISSTSRPLHPHQSSSPYNALADYYASRQRHASQSHHRRPPFPPHLTSSHSASVPQAAPPQPRREIPEEDECPVCTREMPPIGPSGDESARLKHVEDCIKLYSTSTGSGGGTSIPGPNPITTNSSSHPLTHTISASAPSASTSTMPARSAQALGAQANLTAVQRNHRLLRYTATEKDCVNASGEQQECVICMEDFEPGIEMARLDCFCTFHEACIKEWWGRKGVGSCPTHQVTL